MSGISQLLASNLVVQQTAPPSQVAYTTPGTYSWVCPAGVSSISVVVIGGGKGGEDYYGNAGGGLGWKNNIPVVSGTSYTVVVGVGGAARSNGGNSYFVNTSTVMGVGGTLDVGGTYIGDGGGNGGTRTNGFGGGGGAGGYTGNGGPGGPDSQYGSTAGGNGAGGAGGGGAGGSYSFTHNADYSIYTEDIRANAGGGGVGILGQGTNGAGGGTAGISGGGGGSGGANGSSASGSRTGGAGGAYGGGGGIGGQLGTQNGTTTGTPGIGGGGAVRIIWGAGRSFPSTNTGNV